jgi:uncharacterized RDD family membrane protein YckC
MEYASLLKRFGAFIIDYLIVAVCFWLVLIVFHLMYGMPLLVRQDSNLETLLALCLAVVYVAVMEPSARQATVGKQVLGIKITNANGRPITPIASIVRLILVPVSGALLGLGYLTYFFTKKKQFLHDMITNTVVISGNATA